jgi:hypothetical protein
MGIVQPSLGGQELVADAGGGNGLLDRLLPALWPEFTELNSGVGADDGQDGQKAGLPGLGLWNRIR